MMRKSEAVLQALAGKTLSTAESCTGGGIGAELTAVPGSSAVYKGGVVSYCNELKHRILGVPMELLEAYGAVSAPVACAMAEGARRLCKTDAAVSVTGLAGPDGDAYGNPVGTVFVGYADDRGSVSRHYIFSGDREDVRRQALEAALDLILENVCSKGCL